MPTQQEIAQHLGITQQAVSAQMEPLGLDWRNDTMERIRLRYLDHLRGMAAGHKSSAGDDLVAERVQNERIDREIKTLTLAEKRGQLVNIQQLEPMLTQMVTAFRVDLLALADRLKDELDALYGVDVDLQLLTDRTNECLEQLARYDPELQRAGASPGQGDDAAAEDGDDAVGEGTPAHEPEGDGQAGQVQPGTHTVGPLHASGT